MELNKLNELNDKLNELNKQIERKKRQQERLREMDYKKGHEIDELQKELRTASFLINSLNDSKETIYGVFNTKEIGNVLANLASSLIGVKYKFAVELKQDFTCINNHGINYDKEVATLVPKSKQVSVPSWQFQFAQASDPTGEKEDCMSYSCDGYGGYGTCRTRELNSFIKLTKFNSDTNSFEFRKMYGIETADFICDYLVFVSNYRLAHDIINISESELEELLNIFLESYETKYTKYKEEKRELDIKLKEYRERAKSIENEPSLRLSPSYYIKKKNNIGKFGIR